MLKIALAKAAENLEYAQKFAELSDVNLSEENIKKAIWSLAVVIENATCAIQNLSEKLADSDEPLKPKDDK